MGVCSCAGACARSGRQRVQQRCALDSRSCIYSAVLCCASRAFGARSSSFAGCACVCAVARVHVRGLAGSVRSSGVRLTRARASFSLSYTVHHVRLVGAAAALLDVCVCSCAGAFARCRRQREQQRFAHTAVALDSGACIFFAVPLCASRAFGGRSGSFGCARAGALSFGGCVLVCVMAAGACLATAVPSVCVRSTAAVCAYSCVCICSVLFAVCITCVWWAQRQLCCMCACVCSCAGACVRDGSGCLSTAALGV
jgi:hypothetical protein